MEGEGSRKRTTLEVLGADDDEGEGMAAEVVQSKGMREPYRPSKAEREEHERTHVPFRSWCPHCMRGKSKASGHKSSGAEGSQRSKPIISIDYAYLTTAGGGSRAEDEEKAEKEGHTPFLVLHDSESKGSYAYVAGRKGINEPLCRRVVDDLDALGYKEIVIKSDQEPAIVSFIETIKASWNGVAAVENSPVG